jgi:hypothetical protein
MVTPEQNNIVFPVSQIVDNAFRSADSVLVSVFLNFLPIPFVIITVHS